MPVAHQPSAIAPARVDRPYNSRTGTRRIGRPYRVRHYRTEDTPSTVWNDLLRHPARLPIGQVAGTNEF
jgi:hypothetical protein